MQHSGIRRLTSSNNSHLTSNVLLPTSNTFLLVHTVHRSVPSERYCGPTPNPSELGCQASLALARSCWQRVKTAALSDPTFTWHKLVGRLPTDRTAGCRLYQLMVKAALMQGNNIQSSFLADRRHLLLYRRVTTTSFLCENDNPLFWPPRVIRYCLHTSNEISNKCLLFLLSHSNSS